MGEKRFEIRYNDGKEAPYVFDTEQRSSLGTEEAVDLLNSQSAEIADLKRKLEDSQASHLAHHKVLKRVTKANGKFAEGLEINKALNDAQMADRLRMESEIAGLRETVERFRKAARMVQIDIGSKELRDYDRIPIFVSSLGELMRVLNSLTNTSEIPNSSEFLVTEADQLEAEKAIADGSAKLQMPETGHGITEVSDA